MSDHYPIEAKTAVGSAFIRAAHVEVSERPYVFNDIFANMLLTHEEKKEFRESFSNQYYNWTTKKWYRDAGKTILEDHFLGYMQTSPLVPEVLARQVYAESHICTSSSRYFRQYLILGAGLDTFSLRNSDLDLKVYEIDRPIVAGFKKQRLISSDLEKMSRYCSVPIDFECEEFPEKLEESGFRTDLPSIVSWLGVTPYLTFKGIENTFHALSSVLCRSSIVVFDFTLPEALDSRGGCPFTIELADRLEKIGDPLQINLGSEAYVALAKKMGFNLLEILTPDNIQSRYFSSRTDGLRAAEFVCLAAVMRI